MKLTGKQKRALRGMGHSLQPVVYIGRADIGSPQFAAIDQALLDHELIKVKIGKGASIKLNALIDAVEANTRGTCVQKIGKTAMFYAPHPEDPQIKLPRGTAEDDGEDDA